MPGLNSIIIRLNSEIPLKVIWQLLMKCFGHKYCSHIERNYISFNNINDNELKLTAILIYADIIETVKQSKQSNKAEQFFNDNYC